MFNCVDQSGVLDIPRQHVFDANVHDVTVAGPVCIDDQKI
jgi:hypothetical protein